MKKIFLIAVLLAAFGFTANAQQIVYDFNDKSWGEPVTERSESGSFKSSTINDVKFTNAEVYQKDGKGTIRVILDKKSTKSNIEFPAFTEKKELIIEASVGTEERTMLVEEKVGKKWVAIGEPLALTKQKAIYSFKLSDNATQVRISNPTSAALYIYKVTIK